MKKIFILLLLTLILSIPQTAGAKTEALPMGLKIWYPDKWMRSGEAGRIVVRSSDGAAVVMFRVIDTGDSIKAQQIMYRELSGMFTKVIVVTDPSVAVINKLDSVVLDGTGSMSGVYVHWVVRLTIHNDKALMVLGCVESSQFSKNNDTIGKIMQGIKK